MKKRLFFASFTMLLLLILSSSGCKEKENLKDRFFSIEEADMNQEFGSAPENKIIFVKTNLSLNDWKAESEANWLFLSTQEDASQGASLKISATANTSGERRTAVVKILSPVQNYILNVTQYGSSDIVLSEDIKVQPSGGKASECQPGQDIENTWDGKFSADGASPYHSPWGKSANFPVKLEYYFQGGADIDYLIYYTRSGNGNFGEFDLLLATDEGHSDWKKYGSYNFRMQNAPSKITFKTTQKVTGIKFEVKSGAGNFVSCDEMEFYRYNQENTLEKTLLTVFGDITCSTLKEGVTDEQINALPDYFVRLAKALQNNTYDAHEKEFRIREYAPYSIPEEWATKLMTKKYSNLDNPTGISVQQGDEIIVLVGDTHGQQISLQSIWESGQEYKQTNVSGEVYFLSPGVNKLTMRKEGQLFVMYNTDLTSPDAKPIKIHIPMGSGKVTGFFDLKEHKTDEKYAELLKKATHKYFCVRGERIMFYFHTSKMQEFVPNQILSAINLWDDIIGWEQELMGIEDVRPSQVNNHIFAISPEGSYMWASDYCIGFVYTYLKNILLKENVMSAKDNAWGPAHEIGHIHQAAINWPGSTESSNNLFSNYVLYKLGKYCSRGSELNDLADSRFVHKKAWYNMGDATHQGEDTEIHMRMNWQLWNYYHRCGHNPKFWQTLFKLLREDRITESDPGAAQLKFAMKASEAAKEDLTDFFDLWGFFIPGEDTIDQYGTWKYKVTAEMIQEAKDFMKKFPKPKHAFQYIEDRKAGDTGLDTKPSDTGYYTQFEGKVKEISPNIAYTVSGKKYTVENGENAVAFELRKNSAEGELVYFFNMFSYDIPAGVDLTNTKLYAVQADGKRIEIRKK